jgi:DNA-binding transcriptional MocR family regulator
MPGPLYRRVAKALEEDIAAGRLPAGSRLPTHRELAKALDTSVVTASRAYREAAHQGLIQGEVGRGTFVLARASAAVGSGTSVLAPAAARALGAATGAAGVASHARDAGREAGRDAELVDLTENYISAGLELARAPRGAGAGLLWDTLRVRMPPGGTSADRAAGAAWMRAGAFAPRPQQIVVTAGAQHAIAAALGALGRPGDLLYVESLTYPGIKAAARHLNLRLQPVPIDALGLLPRALADLCARNARGGGEAAGGSALGGSGGILYCQPSLHNPTCAIMPAERRRELAAIARRYDLAIVEDNPYGFLLDDPPIALAALAPERTCHIVTCSKALAVGLRVGYLAAPEPLAPKIQAAAAATCLGVTLVELATRWLTDGTSHEIVAAKRREAELRHQLALRCFAPAPTPQAPAAGSSGLNQIAAGHSGRDGFAAAADAAAGTGAAGSAAPASAAAGSAAPAAPTAPARLTFASHPRSSHLWLDLPSPWRAAPFVEQARRRGVAVNPAEPFLASHAAAAPHAIRICLGPPADRARLERALQTLAALLASPPPPEAPVV